jgi:general secretion pathway protein B
MSTISQALIKNKFEQAGGMPPVNQAPNKAIYWKIAFSIAALIIISLLSVLVYLQLYSHKAIQQPVVIVEKIPTKVEQPVSEKALVKMTFETQPIPEPIVIEEIKAPVIAKQAESKQPPLVISSQPTAPKTSLPDVSENVNIDEEPQEVVNYDDIPNDLKERFELAVLLTEMEQNEAITKDTLSDSLTNSFNDSLEDEANDGSDIHLMSSNFQNKIPLIRYDAHVYSSLVPERWIRINGEKLVEGSFDSTGKIELIEVQPQRSIFRVGRQSFSLESLTDWKGY